MSKWSLWKSETYMKLLSILFLCWIRNQWVEVVMEKLMQEGYLHKITLHFTCQWFFRALIILDWIRLMVHEWRWKQWVAIEMGKWNTWKGKTYMELLSISLANGFFEWWLFSTESDLESINDGDKSRLNQVLWTSGYDKLDWMRRVDVGIMNKVE